MIPEPAIEPSTSSRRSTVYVVLPAYNEAANIGPLLEKIDAAMADAIQPYRTVVVDDGSRDSTPAILHDFSARLPLTTARHHLNQGLAATIRDGLKIASDLASDNDVIVTMDADETHVPGLIHRMVEMIREGHDVVIASRYQRGARIYGVSRIRRLFSYVASWMFRILFPIHGVRDYTCGFRAYRAAILRRAFHEYGARFIDQEGFQAMADILLKLRRFDAVMGEVPMILRYDLKQGSSKMRVASTIGKTLSLLVRRRLGR